MSAIRERVHVVEQGSNSFDRRDLYARGGAPDFRSAGAAHRRHSRGSPNRRWVPQEELESAPPPVPSKRYRGRDARRATWRGAMVTGRPSRRTIMDYPEVGSPAQGTTARFGSASHDAISEGFKALIVRLSRRLPSGKKIAPGRRMPLLGNFSAGMSLPRATPAMPGGGFDFRNTVLSQELLTRTGHKSPFDLRARLASQTRKQRAEKILANFH